MRNVGIRKQQTVLESKIKAKNPCADRDHIISRKDIPKTFFHPHWVFAIQIVLVVMYGLAAGIYLQSNDCGTSYLAISILGVTPLIYLFNIQFASRISLSNMYKLYLLQGLWLLIISIVSFAFLSRVLNQTYCSNMWCHPSLDTADYFNHLKEKINKNEYDRICQPIKEQHQIYQSYISRLIVSLSTSMKMYCYKQGFCKERESFDEQKLVRLKYYNILALILILALFQIFLAFYWFYFSYKLKTNKLKLSFYQLEIIMTKKVKGPGQSHKDKNHLKRGMRQDGVIEDQKSIKSSSDNDGMDLEMKKIGNVVHDVDQLFSISSQSNNNKEEELDPKALRKKELQLKQAILENNSNNHKKALQKSINMRDSIDFEINLRRKSLQDIDNIENNNNNINDNNNGHNISFSLNNDFENSNNNNNNNQITNFNDNLSYINDNNMSFNLDTQNINNRDDNTVLPFQPTQTGFYENPEIANTFYNSFTIDNLQSKPNDHNSEKDF